MREKQTNEQRNIERKETQMKMKITRETRSENEKGPRKKEKNQRRTNEQKKSQKVKNIVLGPH